jgi:hypothetical protein
MGKIEDKKLRRCLKEKVRRLERKKIRRLEDEKGRERGRRCGD